MADDDEELKELSKEEKVELFEELESIQEDILESVVPKNENDDRDITLEIKQAAGGSESSLFAAELMEMYKNYCQMMGWRWEQKRLMADQSIGKGCKHGIFKIT